MHDAKYTRNFKVFDNKTKLMKILHLIDHKYEDLISIVPTHHVFTSYSKCFKLQKNKKDGDGDGIKAV